MNNIPEERCSCNARLKHKCCKESTLGGGKMCVKELKDEVVPIPVELIDRIKSLREKAEENIRKDALPQPNSLTVEQAFDLLMDKYSEPLQELSEK